MRASAVILAGLVAGLSGAWGAEAPARPPNVIVILTDDKC